jgi:hypothetical protein
VTRRYKIPTPASSSFKLFRWSINATPSPLILQEPAEPLPCGQELVLVRIPRQMNPIHTQDS